jgi:hypothetical protein
MVLLSLEEGQVRGEGKGGGGGGGAHEVDGDRALVVSGGPVVVQHLETDLPRAYLHQLGIEDESRGGVARAAIGRRAGGGPLHRPHPARVRKGERGRRGARTWTTGGQRRHR